MNFLPLARRHLCGMPRYSEFDLVEETALGVRKVFQQDAVHFANEK